MKRLRLNLPSTATRTDFVLVPLRGLNPVIGAIETKVQSFGVRQAELPALKEMHVNATPACKLTKGYRTSYFQPILHPNPLPRTRLPTAGQNRLACTWDNYCGQAQGLDNEAAQGPSDLDDGIPHRLYRELSVLGPVSRTRHGSATIPHLILDRVRSADRDFLDFIR